MHPLAQSRVDQLPWGNLERARAAPPERRRRRQDGRRECHLCAAVYTTDLCAGGQACPRAHGYRRRDVEWYGGYWVPLALLGLWTAEDRAQVPGAAQSPGGSATCTPPPYTGGVAKPPPLMPDSGGPRCLPKAPPTSEQLARYAALHPPSKAPPLRAGAAAMVWGGTRPPSMVIPPEPPTQVTLPTSRLENRSRSPDVVSRVFTGARAGVFSEVSSDEEEVMFVEPRGGRQDDQATPLPAAGQLGAWADTHQATPLPAAGHPGAWADIHNKKDDGSP